MAYINGKQVLFSTLLPKDNESGTEGLAYNVEGWSRECTGMGTCMESDIVLAKKVDDKTLTDVGANAFDGEKLLTSVIIPEGYVYLRNYCFKDCAYLVKVTMPDTLTMINYAAFQGCISLRSVKIPPNITVFGGNTFYGCTALLKVYIPKGVPQICAKMFYGCTALTDIFYGGTVEEWNAMTKGADWNTNTGAYTIHCTDGDVAKT